MTGAARPPAGLPGCLPALPPQVLLAKLEALTGTAAAAQSLQQYQDMYRWCWLLSTSPACKQPPRARLPASRLASQRAGCRAGSALVPAATDHHYLPALHASLCSRAPLFPAVQDAGGAGVAGVGRAVACRAAAAAAGQEAEGGQRLGGGLEGGSGVRLQVRWLLCHSLSAGRQVGRQAGWQAGTGETLWLGQRWCSRRHAAAGPGVRPPGRQDLSCAQPCRAEPAAAALSPVSRGQDGGSVWDAEPAAAALSPVRKPVRKPVRRGSDGGSVWDAKKAEAVQAARDRELGDVLEALARELTANLAPDGAPRAGRPVRPPLAPPRWPTI